MSFDVADVVREYAQTQPTADAVVVDDRTLTYADLDDRSNRLAQLLLACGAEPAARIAYLDTNAIEAAELLFACAKAGLVFVPLNWRLTEAELQVILENARPAILIAGPAFVDVATRLRAPGTLLVIGDEYEHALATQPSDDPSHASALDDVVLQLYTSGTTGLPKGVLTTHRNMEAVARDASPAWHVDGDSVSLAAMPMFHIGGLGWLFVSLYNGARTLVVPAVDAPSMLEQIERERVTNAFLVPTLLQMLTAVPGAADRDYSALRSIAYGASPITTSVLKAVAATFRCPLFQLYGLTETTGAIVQLDADDHDVGGPREHLLRSAGRPYPWVELRIADSEAGGPAAPGEIGEVWVRSASNTPGYFERPDETTALLTADGWLRTGDGGYLDDEGYLFLTDRIKDMIVSGAENVYPIEVEEVLSQHPGVAEVAVIGTPHERWGETVTAVVVPRAEAAPSSDALVEFARERLAGYKLPRVIDFVDELPKTPTGKVLKRDLRARYRQETA
jgi:long-chain acyl-CoA synthetase